MTDSTGTFFLDSVVLWITFPPNPEKEVTRYPENRDFSGFSPSVRCRTGLGILIICMCVAVCQCQIGIGQRGVVAVYVRGVVLYLRRRRSAIFAPKAQLLFPFPLPPYPSTNTKVLFHISYISGFLKKPRTAIAMGGGTVVQRRKPGL